MIIVDKNKATMAGPDDICGGCKEAFYKKAW